MSTIICVCLWLALCLCAAAQTPAPRQPGATLTLTLQDAMERARQYSQQFLSAEIGARIAHEDRVQAKAALLPALNWEHGYIYTQPNGSDTGVFVANNGQNVFTNWAAVHGDLFSPTKRAEYHVAIAAEAVARARRDIAGRGLAATVVENYYGMAVSARKYANAQLGLSEAQEFFGITQKLERGGEVARSDVVKAQLQLNDRQRDVQDAQLTRDKARIGFAVLLFPDFRQDFTVIDDLDALPPLPTFSEAESLAQNNNPDIRAALASVQQETYGVKTAKSLRLPTLTFDYFFGLNANQYALYNQFHQNNLGSSLQAQMNIPVWTWGAAASRIRQAELRLEQARVDLGFTRRQLAANLNAFYQEANVAYLQLISLKQSLDLAAESLRLTRLRYQAGEVTVLEVVDAQTTLVQARNAYDDGLLRYRVARANLQTITGAF